MLDALDGHLEGACDPRGDADAMEESVFALDGIRRARSWSCTGRRAKVAERRMAVCTRLCIFENALGDVCAFLPDEEEDVDVLEESRECVYA